MVAFSSQKFREMVLQLLFSIDMGDSVEGDLIPFLMRELTISRKTVKSAYQKARSVWDKKKDFDAIIAQFSREYALERVQPVEKNIIRLALFELVVEKESEVKVIIAEAIRLCRKFSTPEASSFVNAILDEYIEHTFPTREKQTIE